jgi:hypothetical protein
MPAIGEQRHRMGHDASRDLEDHHRRSDADHDPSAPFGPREIVHEIVRVLELGVMIAVHRSFKAFTPRSLLQQLREHGNQVKKAAPTPIEGNRAGQTQAAPKTLLPMRLKMFVLLQMTT